MADMINEMVEQAMENGLETVVMEPTARKTSSIVAPVIAFVAGTGIGVALDRGIKAYKEAKIECKADRNKAKAEKLMAKAEKLLAKDQDVVADVEATEVPAEEAAEQ